MKLALLKTFCRIYMTSAMESVKFTLKMLNLEKRTELIFAKLTH